MSKTRSPDQPTKQEKYLLGTKTHYLVWFYNEGVYLFTVIVFTLSELIVLKQRRKWRRVWCLCRAKVVPLQAGRTREGFSKWSSRFFFLCFLSSSVFVFFVFVFVSVGPNLSHYRLAEREEMHQTQIQDFTQRHPELSNKYSFLLEQVHVLI